MFEKIEQIKIWIIEKVIWAEKELDGKTGAEKKSAVVKKIDDMVKLPAYLEWLDDIIIGKIIDSVCKKLNAISGHNFAKLELDAKQEEKIAGEIEVEELKNHE